MKSERSLQNKQEWVRSEIKCIFKTLKMDMFDFHGKLFLTFLPEISCHESCSWLCMMLIMRTVSAPDRKMLNKSNLKLLPKGEGI